MFGKRTKPDEAQLGALKVRIRRIAGLSDDVALAVNEIVCADPACPGTETVILVMAPGCRTRAVKVPGAMAAIEDATIAAAFRADGQA